MLLSILEAKILRGLFPKISEDTAGTEVLSFIFSEQEQHLKA